MAGRPDNRFDAHRRSGSGRPSSTPSRRSGCSATSTPGFFHILIFGGFVVLTVRTLALVVEGPRSRASCSCPGAAGNVYTLVKDVFEVLMLVGVAMAVFRRAFARPEAPRPDLGRLAHPVPDRAS